MGITINTRLFALAAGLALLGSLILVVPFQADDNGYPYLMQDPTQQARYDPPNNSVFSWWALGDPPSHMWWWAEDALEGDVRTAIAAWARVVPKLCTGYLSPKAGCWLTEVGSPDDADVLFALDSNMPQGVYGKADVLDGPCFADSGRNACYWAKAKVRINPNPEANGYAPGARALTIEHEIGHLFGLGERYLPGRSCGSDHSIMNSGLKDSIRDQVAAQSCNGDTGPTALDQQRFNTFWMGGTINQWWVSKYSNNGAYFYFNDYAYGEADDLLNVAGPIGMGQQSTNYKFITNIGLENDASPHRILSFRFNRLDYGLPEGDYYVCGWPEMPLVPFDLHDILSRMTCSPIVHLGP